jgi:hypothetical protein
MRTPGPVRKPARLPVLPFAKLALGLALSGLLSGCGPSQSPPAAPASPASATGATPAPSAYETNKNTDKTLVGPDTRRTR